MNKYFSPTESISALLFNMIFLFFAFSFRDYSYMILFIAILIIIIYMSIKMMLNASFRKTRSAGIYLAIFIGLLVYAGINAIH
ncbi:hypothetical protein [Falsibacillus pallidus]|uniref:hypothetical protein n=1 Tax=Falsibacillus pallidus TaxID=493781 RepID=UPI003D96B34F